MMNPAYRIEWISPLLLRPYTFNARTHSDEQVEQIARSMEEFGWTNPVLIDAENQVIAGHGRLLAAERLGIDAVPCLVLSTLDADQKRAYVLADNKLAENAGWDAALLRLEIVDLKNEGFDLDLIGFSKDELDNILKGLGTDGDGAGDGEKQEFTLMISSKDEAEITALRRIFHINPKANTIKAGDLLAMLPM